MNRKERRRRARRERRLRKHGLPPGTDWVYLGDDRFYTRAGVISGTQWMDLLHTAARGAHSTR